MSPTSPLLIFDSGVGGLSVLEAIRGQLPAVPLQYLADNRFFPYGLLSDEALVERVCHLIPRAVSELGARLVVIACNTASTLVLEPLRARLEVPVIGVVPAIKPAAERSQRRVIGLLATPGTVRRAYTDQLVASFAPDCEVIRVGSRHLVDQAEAKLRGQAVDLSLLREALQPLLEVATVPDQIVLGCTHFPLLRDELLTLLPAGTSLIDSGDAIARRVSQLLVENIESTGPAAWDFQCTLSTPDMDALSPALTARGCRHIRVVDR